uniref:Vacuolar protein sorting-associated protein 62 n=1 Tax=Davidia involucrata TaxID=16924 RepID=A0A5B7A3C6_DAVIN
MSFFAVLLLIFSICFLKDSTMGNCLNLSSSETNISKKNSKLLPIETMFKLPSPIPTWPPGEGFARGNIDLGGLQVCQITTFTKVWATHEGGPDNLGATFFEPSPVPEGFFMLGCYGQPNNRPQFGWVLAGKDVTTNPSGSALKQPIDYTLVWSSESLKIKQDGIGYIWLPTPPDGYKAIGHVVTNSPEKPSLGKIRCVRSDLTDVCQTETWIWGLDKEINANNGFNVFGLRPTNRGTQALGVTPGTFIAQNSTGANLSLACLKNAKSKLSSMPNLSQIQALVQAYSPWVYFHPDEQYFPSSVSWFFQNGALLYKKGDESHPVSIEPTGSNLPQGGSNDGAYWLDLPIDDTAKERVKKGDLQDAGVYVHIKPMLGGTFTDIAIWVFYPFNGAARAKVEFINVSLGKIGEHVGDWEHVTLRISNFNGELKGVYFSQHSGGRWVSASELEFQNGNKPVAYASLHGHAAYPKAGLDLEGNGNIGIRNDAGKSKMVMDTGGRFLVVAAEHLGGSMVVEPPWLNYAREWGPKLSYDIDEEINKVGKVLPGKLKTAFEKFLKGLPDEVLGEQGPTGPKMKDNWSGDERA